MKKTLFAIFLAVVMLVSLVLPASAATGDLAVSAKLNSDGTSFVVELNLKNNPGIIALTTAVSYDSNVLKLKKAENGEIFESIFMPSQTLAVNPYKIIWMDATASEDITTNGVLARYTFEVLSSAPVGETQIKFHVEDVVNKSMDNTAAFNDTSLKVNVRTVSGGTESGNAPSTDASNSVIGDGATNSGVSGDQSLSVQKPSGDNTTDSNDSSAVANTDSTAENTSSETDATVDDENEEEDDVEAKDRTLVTVITIAAVLLVGVCITVTALYFRKKRNLQQ